MALNSLCHRSSFAGTQLSAGRLLAPCLPRVVFSVESAQKKGSGSTKNGRDSISKRRGTKVYGGQPVKAGGIIVRQVGSTWYPGENVGLGKDYTLFSKIPGIVIFEKHRRDHQQVSVYPFEHEKAIANVALTHTTPAKEGVPSRKERRKQLYKPRAQQRAEALAPISEEAPAVAE